MARRPKAAEAAAPEGPRPGRPREFDRDEALDDLTRTFWEHGWAGSSTPVLESTTGLSRSSLANTFGSKREMLVASLAHYNDLIGRHLAEPLERPDGQPDRALHEFFDALQALKASGPGQHGCLVVNTLVELTERDDTVSEQIDRYEQMLLTAFSSALNRLGSRSTAEVEVRAHTLLAVAMAINLHARNHDTTKVAATTAAAHRLIDTWA